MEYKVRISNNEFGFGTEYRSDVEPQEANVGKFADVKLYPTIFKDFKRNTDKDTQMAGVDVYVTGGTKSFTMDEKAPVKNCNYKLETYVMELSSLTKDGNEIGESTGWYFTCTADYVGLYFIDKASTVKPYKHTHLDGSGITETTLVIIDKRKIQEELDKVGWTKEEIIKKKDEIRKDWNICKETEKGKQYRIDLDWCWFYVDKSVQHSINLQFTRKYLEEHAEFICNYNMGTIDYVLNGYKIILDKDGRKTKTRL